MSCTSIYLLRLFVLEDFATPEIVALTSRPKQEDINKAIEFARKELADVKEWDILPPKQIISIVKESFVEYLDEQGYEVLNVIDEKDVFAQP